MNIIPWRQRENGCLLRPPVGPTGDHTRTHARRDHTVAAQSKRSRTHTHQNSGLLRVGPTLKRTACAGHARTHTCTNTQNTHAHTRMHARMHTYQSTDITNKYHTTKNAQARLPSDTAHTNIMHCLLRLHTNTRLVKTIIGQPWCPMVGRSHCRLQVSLSCAVLPSTDYQGTDRRRFVDREINRGNIP